MRVLILTHGVDTPGRMLVEQLSARRDVSVTVMCDCSRSIESLNHYARCHRFATRGKIDLLAIRRLRGELLSVQYDVVHTFSSRLLTNALLAARNIPAPPSVIGFMGFISGFSHWNPVHRLSYLHPRLAGICCNCQAAAEPLAAAGVPPDKLFTVYAGHPFEERVGSLGIEVRREIGIPSDALVVGFAGNMRPVKGADLLLQAAIELSDISNLHWLLLGRVEDRQVECLIKHPAIRNRVHALGWRDDGPRLMQAMDVFAMPSRSEGFSRSVMEAMELGLCPVATRVGGNPEMVRDGIDGLIVPPNDSSALAAAIRRLSSDENLRRSLANSARTRIKSTFTVEQMVHGTVEMYRTVIGAAGRNIAGKTAA